MIKYFCDRCGNEIFLHNRIYIPYKLPIDFHYYDHGQESNIDIDVCLNCYNNIKKQIDIKMNEIVDFINGDIEIE